MMAKRSASAPMIFILYIALVILAHIPLLILRIIMRWHGKEVPGMPGTGGELAEYLVERSGIDAKVLRGKEHEDRYEPGCRTIYLSPSVYDGRSLAAVAVAAHEFGHALQHHEKHPAMAARQQYYRLVQVVEGIAVTLLGLAPIVGIFLRSAALTLVLVLAAIVLFFSRLVMHILTLPLEWDASFGKALPIIQAGRLVAPGEERAVRRVLRAAAFTYVANALADVLSIWRWLLILRRGLL